MVLSLGSDSYQPCLARNFHGDHKVRHVYHFFADVFGLVLASSSSNLYDVSDYAYHSKTFPLQCHLHQLRSLLKLCVVFDLHDSDLRLNVLSQSILKLLSPIHWIQYLCGSKIQQLNEPECIRGYCHLPLFMNSITLFARFVAMK